MAASQHSPLKMLQFVKSCRYMLKLPAIWDRKSKAKTCRGPFTFLYQAKKWAWGNWTTLDQGDPCSKGFLTEFSFFLAAILYSDQSNFEFEYLGEFETEFENILGLDSGAQEGSIDEKKKHRSKISCYHPFKQRPYDWSHCVPTVDLTGRDWRIF